MRPEDYMLLSFPFGGDLLGSSLLKDIGISKASNGCGPATSPAPTKPGVSATRLKGDPIVEMVPVTVGHKQGNVLLELTPEAASVLRGLVGEVCGPDAGPCGQINLIYNALNAVGVPPRFFRCEYGGPMPNIWIQ